MTTLSSGSQTPTATSSPRTWATTSGTRRRKVGDRPHLIFYPADPPGNVADERTGPDFFTVWALVLGALVAMVLAVPTWSGRLDWNKLR